MNYIAVSAVTVFLFLPGSIVARSQSLAADQMSHASSPAEASSLVHESGSSWKQWLYHHTRISMQKSDIGVPQSAGAPSTGPETEVPGRQQQAISQDEDRGHRERSGIRGLMKVDSLHSVESLLNHHDGHHSSLLEPVP